MSSSPADILAVIPFYKRQDQLDKCLAALAASTHPVEPYIHDNNTDNIGYTKACNLGLREAMRRGHKYAILLNQDCYMKPNAIANAIAFMDAHPNCAIAGPKQLRAEDPDQIIHGGCSDAYPLGRHFIGNVSKNDCAMSLPMPWVNGACMVIRVEALYHTGLMDEGFFVIASDSDFCFTARQRGFEVWYCAESVVLHEGGGVSSGPKGLEMMAHFNADQVRFRDKWIGTHGWELLKQLPPPPKSVGTVPAAQINAAVQAAIQHFNKNELPQAELLVRQILAHVPDHADALLILAKTYTRLNLCALAARELKKVVAEVPDSANAHLALADAYIMSNFPEEAVTHYTRAKQLGLNTAELSNNLGVSYQRLGKKDDAILEWKNALALDPKNEVARKNLIDMGISVPGIPPSPTPTQTSFNSGTFRLGGK